MSPSNISGFSCEIHLDVKYHMTLDPFIPNGYLFLLIRIFKGNPIILHFLMDCVSPKHRLGHSAYF
jgi:hypothetical protein